MVGVETSIRLKDGLSLAARVMTVALIACLSGFSSVQTAVAGEPKFFGDRYLPTQDQMTHHTADEAYPAKPEPLVIKDRSSYLQPWNEYCTQSLLSDDRAKLLPCQTANIKPSLKYRSVEVVGNKWMKLSCAEELKSVQNGGGPFSSVIVQIDDETGKVIRYRISHNHVTQWIDPTAHGEVKDIRQSGKGLNVLDFGKIKEDDPNLKLPRFCQISHCDRYTSAEPCPMCYAATRWARIGNIYFAATVCDAAQQGVTFSGEPIYAEM